MTDILAVVTQEIQKVATVDKETIVTVIETPSVVIAETPGTVTVQQNSVVVAEGKTEIQLVEVGLQGPVGPPGTVEEEMPYAKRTDFESDTVLYKGEAAVGSAESAAAWRISRMTFAVDGDVKQEWAEGSALFNKVWDDRATYLYS
jgi:hypothetical protein